MRTAVHGMARMGARRELKWALESHWGGGAETADLGGVAAAVRRRNWELLRDAGIDEVPSNDFSLYDHVLDAAIALGAVPERFLDLPPGGNGDAALERYFAMARGGRVTGHVVPALELTKWFDTNYHHLVPEVGPSTTFHADSTKACGELTEAAALGISTTPVLLGPFTFLLRSKALGGFSPLSLLDPLVETYLELLAELACNGAVRVRMDEPALVEDRTPEELAAFVRAYERIAAATVQPAIVVSTYFGHVGEAMGALAALPVEGIGLDFCAGPENAGLLAAAGGLGRKTLYAGVVDGRNVWANDLGASLDLLGSLEGLATDVVVSTSCSLLHVPDTVSVEKGIAPEIRAQLAFGQEKLAELRVLATGATEGRSAIADALEENARVRAERRASPVVHVEEVAAALGSAPEDPRRADPAAARAATQRARLGLPLLPTTTIGSFPQTREVRRLRASWRRGDVTDDAYREGIRAEIARVVSLQERLGVDVLVHGEPERDDMVRYFAAHLGGFVLPEEGWVQSYGSRCVRPPIVVGDVSRPSPITLEWTTYASSLTEKPLKAMLTGPVTMLRWSFPRDDVDQATTAAQLGLAIGQEVADLDEAGVPVVQVDEPALREGMPLRRSGRDKYLGWATRAFRLATSRASSSVQVHTHMCYAELGQVVDALDDLDVDVVSFEAARSGMEVLSDLSDLSNLSGVEYEGGGYSGGVGPGVYDVHSPAVPSAAEIEALLGAAVAALGADRLWVNPDCGLKTRTYDQVVAALSNLVEAAAAVRAEVEARGALAPSS